MSARREPARVRSSVVVITSVFAWKRLGLDLAKSIEYPRVSSIPCRVFRSASWEPTIVTITPEEQVIARRFGIERPSVLVVDGISEDPVIFARLRNDKVVNGRTLEVPLEKAFTFQVMLRHLASAECWIDGRHFHVPPSDPGSTLLFDLTSNPVVQPNSAFDKVRFYITKASLEKLSYESGGGIVSSLAAKSLSNSDPTMYGLALAIAATLDDRPADIRLFSESIALAFLSHVARAYGSDGARSLSKGSRGTLAPWQLKRASEMMITSPQGTTSIGAMAGECRISTSHFARAFKQTTGSSPHQWLLLRRVEAAKALLLNPGIRMSDIALERDDFTLKRIPSW